MINELFVHNSMFVLSLNLVHINLKSTLSSNRERAIFTCFLLTERIRFITENYNICLHQGVTENEMIHVLVDKVPTDERAILSNLN